VTTDDTVQVAGWNSAPNQKLVVTVRFLLATGPTILGQYVYPIPSDRSFFSFQIPLVNGYMLAVTADLFPTGATKAQRGQCFVYANIIRAGAIPQIEAFVLFSDYASADFSPSWPSYTNQSSLSGIGAIRSVVGTAPAPGQQVKEVVPSNARWLYQSIYLVFQTSAAAGNRNVGIYFDDANANTMFAYAFNYNQPASTQVSYSFGSGVGSPYISQPTGGILGPIPPFYADAGWNWQTNIAGMQAGDQITFVQYCVQEWVNPGI